MYRAYYHAGYRQTAKISAFYADNGKYEPRDRHEKREHKADYGAHIGTGRRAGGAYVFPTLAWFAPQWGQKFASSLILVPHFLQYMIFSR